jgi:hypothetical protein
MALWQFRKAVRFAVVFTVLTACASTQIAQTCAADIGGWHKLDAGPFSILAPSGWEFHQLMGYDSFLGEFVGDGVRLRFDYGRYSNGYLKNAKREHIVSKRSIDGHSAKVANPRTPGSGLTGVYVKLEGHNALWLWGEGLTRAQQELVLKMFDTLRFGGPMPSYVVPPPPPPAPQPSGGPHVVGGNPQGHRQ